MRDTKIVGILNVTPDSFSDGGQYLEPAAALDAIARMVGEGADVIDIGAESTRPGAMPVSATEEWIRLQPVLEALEDIAGGPVEFSVDTRHAENAARALDYGIDWINDVSGFSQSAMIKAVKASHCRLVVMHSLSVPADKSIVLPENANVAEEVLIWGRERIGVLEAAGIDRERLIFDPGIGFGKTARQSWELLDNITRFHELKVPIMVGHSRKSFLTGDRDAETLEVSRKLMDAGVDYLRVHDVVLHRGLIDA